MLRGGKKPLCFLSPIMYVIGAFYFSMKLHFKKNNSWNLKNNNTFVATK
jgi:hypothetical protein